MRKNSDMKLILKENLILTTLENEGLATDLNTRKTYWMNGTACDLLNLFKKNRKGFTLSSVKSFLEQNNQSVSRNKIFKDLFYFINRLMNYGLIIGCKKFNGEKLEVIASQEKFDYMKPIVKEEMGTFAITKAGQRTGVSKAVSAARHSGLRAF